MHRLIAILIISLFVAAPFTAEAKNKEIKQQVDMEQYTCGDLLSEKEDDIGAVLIWVDGYLSAKTGDTTININFLSKLGEAVGEACAKDKKAKLLEVVRNFME
jgi:acid stress chaperone HdeB